MNVIFLSKREGKARQLNLAHPLTLSLIGGFVLVVLGSAFVPGVQLGRDGQGRLRSGDALQRVGDALAQEGPDRPSSSSSCRSGSTPWRCASAR